MRLTLLVLAALAVSGCGATMVIPPGSGADVPFAPVNERARSGVVKYLNQGSTPGNARREDAYRRMYESCQGNYRIVEEWLATEGKEITRSGDSLEFRESRYIYIRFECVQ